MWLKIGLYGETVETVKWFESYLSDRLQCVKVNGLKSCLMPLKRGVPQGSIVGTILFDCSLHQRSTSACHQLIRMLTFMPMTQHLLLTQGGMLTNHSWRRTIFKLNVLAEKNRGVTIRGLQTAEPPEPAETIIVCKKKGMK